MLSYAQTVLVAARSGDGDVLCLDCFKAHLAYMTDTPEYMLDLGDMRQWLSTGEARNDGWYGIIEYVMDSEYNEDGVGVYCDWCGKELAKPYCHVCSSEEDLTYCNEYGEDVGECYYYCPEHVPGAVSKDIADTLAPNPADEAEQYLNKLMDVD